MLYSYYSNHTNLKSGLSLLILLMLVCTSGCKSTEEEEYYPESEGNLSLRVSQTTVMLPAFDASELIEVESNSKWTVSDPDDNSWLKFSFESEERGVGNGVFKIIAENNTSKEVRQATVEVAGPTKIERINVTQVAGDMYVTPTQLSFSAEGGQQTFTVICTVPWTLKCYDDWLSLDRTSGSGTGEEEKINVTATSNTHSSEIRTGRILLESSQGNMEISISQLSNSLPLVYVTPTSLTIGSQGGNTQLTMRAFYPWKITCLESWVSIDKLQGGGEGEIEVINLKVDENTMTNQRTASLFIESPSSQFTPITVTITQGGSNDIIIQTPQVTNITTEGASISCNYFTDMNIVEKGIRLSTDSNFAYDNIITIFDTNEINGKISVDATALTPNTKYYVKGYILTSDSGLIESNAVEFTTLKLNRPEAGDNPTPQ